MKIEVEAISPVEKKVTVEVDPERVARELDKAYAGLGRRVKLRGFRAGHVPRNVLERHFRDEVERQVVDTVVNASFGEAVSQHDLQPVASPRVDVAEPGLAAGQPFRYSARVEVKPRLEPKDYKQLEVTRKPAEVTDQMVSDELTRIQDSLSRLVPVEGRFEAQTGDYAVIDHEGTVDGQPFEGSKAEGVTIKVEPGDLTAGFIPQLAGAKVGDAVELDQTFPADAGYEPLRGKTAHFRVKLQSLKSREVPSIDDELAKNVGLEGIETLDALKARIRADLEKRETQRAEAELKDAVIKAALAKNEFEVPPAMVEHAIDVMLQGAFSRFARQGLDPRQLDLDIPRLRADLREQALLQVKGALLLESIADAEKIEVTDDDVQAELARMSGEMGIPLAKLQQQMKGGNARSALRNRLREDRALAFLTSEATLK
ncbi:trigger factor [Anaeromyxobacter paludicola]|uniref:Trigger factor n=1 Tax=Anaeromyxobacter paludicola TaxID=2918171 RepID=A0ABN6NBK7_9BACT|nr:trigger factor [Anaeromyxobacter paludicola]BDG10610.1 trigger factor [Anaeromyxobacter paludicola]